MTANLDRFIAAQQNTYETAKQEIATGHKTSHWMWFIFPQIIGLGHSDMAKRFGLKNLNEAQAYLAHPVLGERLRELTRILVEEVENRSAEEIFGYPDYLKFHSCLTLFNEAERASDTKGKNGIFAQALTKFYFGKPDSATLVILNLEK